MKVLVVGSGGREHALVWKLSQSSRVDKIFCAPGNAGIAMMAKCINIKADDIESLLSFAKYEGIDLTVVGPEDPLTKGIVDAFEKEGRLIFGTNKKASQFEGSKVFAKDFMLKYGIPTAEYKVFTTLSEAEDYVRLKGAPLVIKADGLAAGKGVIIAETVNEAIDALKLIIFDKKFGKAGNRVVIEQCLRGEEASFMVLIDGKTILPLASSQDHKRIFDNDAGPNTGGMGAYSPAPVVTEELQKKIMDTVMAPFMEGITREEIDFRGVLYAGIMVCDGNPYVLEYNCRFGDPEAQPILMRLETDLYDLMKATAQGRLDEIDIAWKDDTSICVVLAAKGYPDSYEKGRVIKGLDSLKGRDDVFVFHSGTSRNDKGDIITSGGRVLGETGARGHLTASRVAVGEQCSYGIEVRGTEGALTWDFRRMGELAVCLGQDYQDAAWETRLVRPGDGELAAFQPGAGVAMGYDDLKVIEARRLAESIVTGTPGGATIEDVVHTAELIEAMVTSYEQRRWVTL